MLNYQRVLFLVVILWDEGLSEMEHDDLPYFLAKAGTMETPLLMRPCRAHGCCDWARPMGSNVLWGLALYQFLLQDFRWFSTSGVPAGTGHSSGCANLQINHGMFTTYQLVQDFATIQTGSKKNLPLQVPYGSIRSLIRGWHRMAFRDGQFWCPRFWHVTPFPIPKNLYFPTSLYTPFFLNSSHSSLSHC